MLIIVKYHSMFDAFTLEDSIFGTFTANSCGVTKKIYNSRAEALPDLEKVIRLNPTVDYGIVEVKD